jgi:hypothetical protein
MHEQKCDEGNPEYDVFIASEDFAHRQKLLLFEYCIRALRSGTVMSVEQARCELVGGGHTPVRMTDGSSNQPLRLPVQTHWLLLTPGLIQTWPQSNLCRSKLCRRPFSLDRNAYRALFVGAQLPLANTCCMLLKRVSRWSCVLIVKLDCNYKVHDQRSYLTP